MRDPAHVRAVAAIARPPANLPKLAPAEHNLLIETALRHAELTRRINVTGPRPLGVAQNGVYSLAQWQTPRCQKKTRLL